MSVRDHLTQCFVLNCRDHIPPPVKGPQGYGIARQCRECVWSEVWVLETARSARSKFWVTSPPDDSTCFQISEQHSHRSYSSRNHAECLCHVLNAYIIRCQKTLEELLPIGYLGHSWPCKRWPHPFGLVHAVVSVVSRMREHHARPFQSVRMKRVLLTLFHNAWHIVLSHCHRTSFSHLICQRTTYVSSSAVTWRSSADESS